MAVNFYDCSDLHSLKNILFCDTNLSFTVLHVNIRSVRKYWDEFTVLAGNVDDLVDAFVLTELNVSNDEVGLFELSGHHSFFYTRQSGRGGGIGVYIKEKWSVSSLNISFLHAEVLALSIQSAVYSITLLAIYRPPSNSTARFLDELRDLLNSLDSTLQLCLIGDFNIDILNPSKSITSDYLNILAHFGIECCIQSPTREELRGSNLASSCIDHINLRVNDGEIRSVVISEKLADHYFTACQVIMDVGNDAICSNSRYISFVDKNKLDSFIASFDWTTFALSTDGCDLYAKFTETLSSLRKKCEKRIKIKKRKPNQLWLNSNILEAIRHKDYLWSRCRHSPKNALYKIEYKIARNKINALIRSSRRTYYKEQFSQSRFNLRRTWNLANELRGARKSCLSDAPITQHFSSDTKALANEFNDFFIRVSGVVSLNSSSVVTLCNSTRESAFLPTLSECDLHSLLFSLNRYKSAGFDGIRVDDLCRNFGVLKHVLLLILNDIITSGIFPHALKTAVVTPLFKGGSRGDVQSYRPISILSCVSQILEKHLFLTMTGFLDKHDVIAPHQYGFVTGRGTQSLLDDFSDYLYSSFENNQFVCALFLDVSKAFDTVNHKILCSKLEKIGFRGPFLKLLENFLFDRSQRVSIEKVSSRLVSLKTGVPQGSILSPLLFNIYVNDISNVISNSQIFQYADDTVLLSRHLYYTDAVRLLQQDTLEIMKWFESNKLLVNTSKTKLVCFRNPLKMVSYIPFYLHTSCCTSCNCIPVEYVDSAKYLGVYFDSDLSWNTHLSSVCKRLRSVSCCMYRLKNVIPCSVRKMIVHALAYSILRYGITIFGNCSMSWQSKIDAILKSILKSVAYGCSFPPETTLFNFLKLPSFHTLFIETVVLRYYWSDSFRTIRTCRPLRQVSRFQVPHCRTHFGENVRQCYIPRVFNNLSESCFNLNTKQSLKKALKEIRS